MQDINLIQVLWNYMKMHYEPKTSDFIIVFGKGFSCTNLQNMRLLYQYYPKCQKSGELSWSHYCELVMIKDKEKRDFYEKMYKF